MSSFYTVNTSNAFAALDLSDDEPARILPSTLAPKPKVEEVPVVAPVRESPQRPTRGGGRGGRGRGGNDGARGGSRQQRENNGEAGEQTEGGNDSERRPSGTEGRGRGGRGRGGNDSRRGGRDYAAPQGGNKRIFDRKTGHEGQTRPEDHDPEQETRDEAAGEAIANSDSRDYRNYDNRNRDYDNRNREDQAPREPVVVEEPTISVQAYFKTVESQTVSTGSVTKASDDHVALNKEMVESGYKQLETKVEVGGKLPGSNIKAAKQQKERGGMHLFEAVPMPPVNLNENRGDDRRNNDRDSSRPRRDNNRDRPARPDNRNNEDTRSPAPATAPAASAAPAPATSTKPAKPLKDDAEYPTLG